MIVNALKNLKPYKVYFFNYLNVGLVRYFEGTFEGSAPLQWKWLLPIASP